ncbi:hypothetical protein NDU88_008001 [Pleurodeles waltl]|uniref:Uncharacterized protein n=1 Tax=Pleurodeles waltl TaxID=8319 RepID=A0AAV7NWI6_PLEWA|nr:hypothetical protein NDU88_008001 [Pleurodeles waltl]
MLKQYLELIHLQNGCDNASKLAEASGVRPRRESMHDRQRTLSLSATWIPVQPAFVSGIYNTIYFKNTTFDNGPYIFFKPPEKQQSNVSEICNEDQEKENTFDYGLDTSFKPDEWCNVENNLLSKRTISRNMTITIYCVPSRTNNVPDKSPTGILHANESIDLPHGLAAQCYKAWNRRQKQTATRRNSTIMVYLEFSRKSRQLHYTPTENVLVKEAIDFPYDSSFLATQKNNNGSTFVRKQKA